MDTQLTLTQHSRPSTRQSLREKLSETRRSGRFSSYSNRISEIAPTRSAAATPHLAIPRALSEAQGSNALLLSSMQLMELPEMENVNLIFSADLSNNRFEDVPDDLHEHADTLQKLFMFSNRITAIPDSIGRLTQLVELHVSYNKIQHISDNIRLLQRLRVLNLNNNELTDIPEAIGELRFLESLNLSYNRIVLLPPDIGNLINLKQLNLTCNQLIHLPREVGYLESLEVLKWEENPWEFPPREVMQAGVHVIVEYLRTMVPPDTDPRFCRVEGEALQGGVVAQQNQFRIIAYDQFRRPKYTGGDNFVVHISGPSETVQITGNDNGDGTYDISFMTTIAGLYTMSITLNDDVPLGCGPFEINIVAGPTDARRCVASGVGSAQATAGVRSTFVVHARDEYQNDCTIGTAHFHVHASCDTAVVDGTVNPIGQGRYVVSYSLPYPGLYQLSVKLGDEHIAGSPFVVTCVSGREPPPRPSSSLEERARRTMQSRASRPTSQMSDTRLMRSLGLGTLRSEHMDRPKTSPALPRVYMKRMLASAPSPTRTISRSSSRPVEEEFPEPLQHQS